MLSALGVAAAVAETDLTVLVRVVHETFYLPFGIDIRLAPIFVGEFLGSTSSSITDLLSAFLVI